MTLKANIFLVIIVGFLLAFWLRFGSTALPNDYVVTLLFTLLLSAVIFPAIGAFREEFRWEIARSIRRTLAGWLVILLLLISTAAALKVTDYFSRIWFGLWVTVTAVGLAIVHLITYAAAIRSRRQNSLPIVLVGSGRVAETVECRLKEDSAAQFTIVARFGSPWSSKATRPFSELSEFVNNNTVHAVWIAVPWQDKQTLDESLRALRDSTVDVNVVPDLEQYRLLNQNIVQWGGLPIICLAGTPMTDAERRLKILIDFVISMVMLVALSPLMVLIAFCVKLSSPGPVLFRQLRHGIGGETIEILKFRTMNIHHEEPGQLTQATVGDDRITRFGRLLRRTSMDELPQLINVLRGEMSLVGPRPHAVEHNDAFKSQIPRYMLRHKVKPGITGWAQINGFRGETDTKEKMALRIQNDLWYIRNWSLWLDFKILLMTPFSLLHRNAY